MKFEITMPPRLVFGVGVVNDAGPIAKAFGSRAFVVTGKDLQRAEPLRANLRAHGVDTVIFSVSGEPTLDTVEQGIARAREENCDVVIGFGGGSALDAAKAIAGMLTNEGALLDYLEVIGRGRALARPGAPFIAIPTTAGTGSEVTRNAVLGSPAHRVKVSLRSPLLLARVALVDPEQTLDLPPALTASTGLDALTQLIEPYVCTRANPLTDGWCVEGMRCAARSLRVAFAAGHDRAARVDMALASTLGGLALANAGLGAVHGLAGPIGGAFPAPHGAVCAVLLPHVMTVNVRAMRERAPDSVALRRYEDVARLLTGHAQATAEDGVAWVAALTAEFKVPGLSHYGICSADHSELAQQGLRASSMKANPIALSASELTEVLQQAA